MDTYKSEDGYAFESEELWKSSTMRFHCDSWAELSAAFTPKVVFDVTFPNDDRTVFTADYFDARYKRIVELANALEQTGDTSLVECAAEVRKTIAPYRVKLDKYLAEKAGH